MIRPVGNDCVRGCVCEGGVVKGRLREGQATLALLLAARPAVIGSVNKALLFTSETLSEQGASRKREVPALVPGVDVSCTQNEGSHPEVWHEGASCLHSGGICLQRPCCSATFNRRLTSTVVSLRSRCAHRFS